MSTSESWGIKNTMRNAPAMQHWIIGLLAWKALHIFTFNMQLSNEKSQKPHV